MQKQLLQNFRKFLRKTPVMGLFCKNCLLKACNFSKIALHQIYYPGNFPETCRTVILLPGNNCFCSKCIFVEILAIHFHLDHSKSQGSSKVYVKGLAMSCYYWTLEY